MSLDRFYMSRSMQTAWGVTMRAPDDEHEEPWLPDWVTVSWPPDAEIAPNPPNDLSQNWRLVFPETGDVYWESYDPWESQGV